MRRCPKCSVTSNDASHICRSCGAILNDVPDESEAVDPAVASFDDRATDDAESDSTADSHQEVEAEMDVPQADQVPAGRCAACGSARIIPNAQVVDQGQHSSGSLSVVVYGDPDALIFKDRLFGTLTADICGDCGHVQMRVQNPAVLYEHYLQSQK